MDFGAPSVCVNCTAQRGYRYYLIKTKVTHENIEQYLYIVNIFGLYD